MITLRRLATFVLLAAPLTLPAQVKPGELDMALRQMDAASTKFKSAEADFQWDFYEMVVKETTTQHGNIYFKKNGAKLEMGAKILPPGAKFLSYKDDKLAIFDPGTKELKVLTAGKNKTRFESITDLGVEQLSDGSATVPTTKLNLIPKDPDVKNMFTHILIWVDLNRGISLKQQAFTPSGDYRTTIYSNIRYNQAVNTKPYEYKK